MEEVFYLSQHFDENTYLVAGKCVKCYRESQNVQIVGVNNIFLKNYGVNENAKKYLEKIDLNQNFFVFLDNRFDNFKINNQEDFEDNKDEIQIKFVPPKSPYNLIEEELYQDPWKLLVATIFLNKTSLRFSKDHLEWFFHSFENPQKVLQTEISSLEKYFENLGLQRTRSIQVYYMTHDYLFKKWKKVEELFGIGEYGRDAYNMFCLGNFDVEPKDRYLRIYKNWYKKVYLQDETEFARNFYKAVSQKDRTTETS